MGLFSRSAPTTTTAAPAGGATMPAGPGGPLTPVTAPPVALMSAPARANAHVAPVPVARGEREIYFEKMKVRMHGQLVERLDVQNLKTLPPETVRQEVRALIRELCQSEKGLLNSSDQER